MNTEQGFAVELEHRVNGSPAEVFEYFTDPVKHRRWHGRDCELDARPGGAYRIGYVPGVNVRGEYVVVDPPRRIIMTWGWESDDFALPRGLGSVAAGSSTVEFTFEKDGDGTIIRVRHSGLPSELACWAHEVGWTSYLPRLTSLTQGREPGPDPSLELAYTYFARDEDER